MTREEARLYGEEYLNDLISAACDISEKHKEFVNMAIEALSTEPCEDGMWSLKDVADALKRHGLLQRQVPCEDAISRQAVLNTLDKMDDVLDEDRTVETYKMLLTECVSVLPSVTPKVEECEDCISREQAIKQCGFGMTDLLIAGCLRRLPSVTPQQKMGRWIKANPWTKPYCSECGESCFGVHGFDCITTDFCPMCGARMAESEDTE